MKNEERKDGIFANKKVVLVVSVILAAICWVAVAGFIRPGEETVIRDITIDYTRDADTYADRNLKIVSNLSDIYADAKVNGDGSLLGSLSSSSVAVYADYSNVTTPGTHEVPLKVAKVTTGDYSVAAWSVSGGRYSVEGEIKTRVTIVFEEVERKSFAVNVKSDGVTAAQGYVKGTPEVAPGEIIISGSKSQVARIASVQAVITGEEELTERKKYTGVALTLLDSNGEALDTAGMGLEFNAQTVDVTIDITQIRTINLTASFRLPSDLDSKWFYDRVKLSEPTMRVAGSDEDFEHLDNPYSIYTFDASQLEMGWESQPITITLPGNLTSYDQLRQVTVYFDTTGLTEKIIEVPVENIQVVNSPHNAKITPLDEPVSVHLIGDTEQLEALLGDNIILEVDAVDVTATSGGQQTIAARVRIPSADKVFAVGKYSVVCNVELT